MFAWRVLDDHFCGKHDHVFGDFLWVISRDDNCMRGGRTANVQPIIVGFGDADEKIVVGFGILALEDRESPRTEEFANAVALVGAVFLFLGGDDVIVQPVFLSRLLL